MNCLVQTKCFDTKAQKQSDEVNKKFKSWKSKPSMIWTSIQKFHSEHSKFKLKDIQFQIMEEVRENHPDKTDSEVNDIVKNLLIKLGSRPTFFDKSEFLFVSDPQPTLKSDISKIQKLQVGMFLKNFSFIKILYHV